MTDTADTIAPSSEGSETVIDEVAAQASESVAVGDDDKVNMALDSQDVIKTHVIAAMAVGLVPLPGVDLAGTVAVQVRMVNQICEIYGVRIRENAASTIVLSLIGGVLPVVLAGTFVSGLKVIPGLGSLAGAAGSSILGGAVTYAIGSVFQKHLDTHDSLIDFDVEKAKTVMQGELATGMKVARSLRDKVTGAIGSKAKPDDAVAGETPSETEGAKPSDPSAGESASAFSTGMKVARSLRDKVTGMIAQKGPTDEAVASEPADALATGLKVARSLRDKVTGMIVPKAKPDEAVAAEVPPVAETAPTAEAAPTSESVAETEAVAAPGPVAETEKDSLPTADKGGKVASASSAV